MNDIQSPLVSICIPSYHSAEFIAATLQSVLNQTYTNLEIIIVDDHSKDATAAIVGSFQDKRIRFYSNETNLGAYTNWNKSIQLATGHYIKLMGADDLLHPSCIEEQLAIFMQASHRNISLVSSYKNVINNKGKLILTKKSFASSPVTRIQALTACIKDGSNQIGEPVAGLFKKSDFIKAGSYTSEYKYVLDLDLWSRLLQFGDLYVIPKALYSFRISKGALSNQLVRNQISEFESFRKKLMQLGIIHLSTLDQKVAQLKIVLKGIARILIIKLRG